MSTMDFGAIMAEILSEPAGKPAEKIGKTTAQVVYDLLVENTGRHLLDSGGAYGRAFERNQARTIEDFEADPECELREYVGPTVSVFHFLTKMMDFDSRMQELFDAYVKAHDDVHRYWLEDMEGFADEVMAGRRRWEDGPLVENTYNRENILSQDLQYVLFKWDPKDHVVVDIVDDDAVEDYEAALERLPVEGVYALLQVHGGCDARGGYTAPAAFQVDDSWSSVGGAWGRILDASSQFSLACPDREGCGFVADTEDGSGSCFTDVEGTPLPKDQHEHLHQALWGSAEEQTCPKCKAHRLEAYSHLDW